MRGTLLAAGFLAALAFAPRPAGAADVMPDYDVQLPENEDGRVFCREALGYKRILDGDKLIACRKDPPRFLMKGPSGKYRFLEKCPPDREELVLHSPLPGDRACLLPGHEPRLFASFGSDQETSDCGLGRA
ncbi:MAG TPA: hypothetical protein VNI01_12390, partial [Elusimicrobiota bacterium]|nr:hypothetical protein [Elusimicrobiota bacterium]